MPESSISRVGGELGPGLKAVAQPVLPEMSTAAMFCRLTAPWLSWLKPPPIVSTPWPRAQTRGGLFGEGSQAVTAEEDRSMEARYLRGNPPKLVNPPRR